MTMQSLRYSLLHRLMNTCPAAFWPWTCNPTLWLKRTMGDRRTRRRQVKCSLKSPAWSPCACVSLAILFIGHIIGFQCFHLLTWCTGKIVILSTKQWLLCSTLDCFTKQILPKKYFKGLVSCQASRYLAFDWISETVQRSVFISTNMWTFLHI